MGSVVNSWSTWSRRLADNVSCWFCEHFQRFDATATPTNCEGECKKEAPRKAMLTVHPTKDIWVNDSFWTFIPYGNVGWCSGFQRSLEDNIPPPPGTNINECATLDPEAWINPREVHIGNLAPGPSKKSMLDSCWYCSHFQRQSEEIGSNDDCHGYCQIAPPEDFTVDYPDYETAPRDLLMTMKWPYIMWAPWNWCSRWERNRQTVEPPPDFGGFVCGRGAP